MTTSPARIISAIRAHFAGVPGLPPARRSYCRRLRLLRYRLRLRMTRLLAVPAKWRVTFTGAAVELTVAGRQQRWLRDKGWCKLQAETSVS